MKFEIANVFAAGFLACGLSLIVTGCEGADDALDDESNGENIETTSQAFSLGSSLGKPVYSSNTCGLNNGVTPGCTASSASDMSFQWTAPSSGTFTFSTSGSSFDTVLVIADYSSPSSVLACAGSVSGTGGESVSLALASGKQLLVTVDGYASLCGPFKLNITKNCTFNGQSYQDGQSVASGVRCSSKYNGYCIGGVFAGKECVASGECYATCSNGTWE